MVLTSRTISPSMLTKNTGFAICVKNCSIPGMGNLAKMLFRLQHKTHERASVHSLPPRSLKYPNVVRAKPGRNFLYEMLISTEPSGRARKKYSLFVLAIVVLAMAFQPDV